MSRAQVFVLLSAIAYVICGYFFIAALDSLPDSLMGRVFLGAGLFSLLATAMDLAMLTVFACHLGFIGYRDAVPLVLTDEELATLQDSSPKAAIMIPAHGEAATDADAQALGMRVAHIARATPGWSSIWLLFDSPADQAAREQGAIASARKWLVDQGDVAAAERIHYVEYRDKPSELRNKPGSIWLFLGEHTEFEYVMLLDADSSLENPDNRAELRNVLERAVWTMRKESRVGFVQGCLELRNYTTLWEWYQYNGSLVSKRYTGPLYAWLYARDAPCFGHGVVFDARQLYKHCQLTYLSHDHVEAASMAAAGIHGVFTTAIATTETTEATFVGYCARSARWCRGNVQWVYFLAKHGSNLPLAAKLYLMIGILNYIFPLASILLWVSAAAVTYQSGTFFRSLAEPAVAMMLSLSLLGMLGSKMLAIQSLPRLIGTLVVGVLMAPPLACLEAVMFLTAPFGSGWVFRDARQIEWNLREAWSNTRMCLPLAIAGMGMMLLLKNSEADGPVQSMLYLVAASLVASPCLAVLVSYPFFPERAQSDG